jgi:dolichol kinase
MEHRTLDFSGPMEYGGKVINPGGEIRSELVRKALHFFIALAPVLSSFHRWLTLILLAVGTLVYALLESLRMGGVRFPVISPLTDLASRERDKGHFVLGPVTLGMGAFLSILIFPRKTAEIAVFALAFGDGTASLAGKMFGRIRLPLPGKTLEGSLACLLGTFISAALVSKSLPVAAAAALAAVTAEALPVRDWDNVIIPMVTGFTVLFLFRF